MGLIPQLDGISNAQLLHELDFRNSGRLPGRDWYFLFGDDPDDNDYIFIVHKKFWHEHHCIDDQCIKEYLVLPHYFKEADTSKFTYNSHSQPFRSIAGALEDLVKLGYSRIEMLSWDDVVHHAINLEVPNIQNLSINIRCDDPRIKTALEGLDFFNFETLFHYEDYVRSASFQTTDIRFYVNLFKEDDIHNRKYSAVAIATDVYQKLPIYPKGYIVVPDHVS